LETVLEFEGRRVFFTNFAGVLLLANVAALDLGCKIWLPARGVSFTAEDWPLGV
jgi:hypothetical protein